MWREAILECVQSDPDKDEWFNVLHSTRTMDRESPGRQFRGLKWHILHTVLESLNVTVSSFSVYF